MNIDLDSREYTTIIAALTLYRREAPDSEAVDQLVVRLNETHGIWLVVQERINKEFVRYASGGQLDTLGFTANPETKAD